MSLPLPVSSAALVLLAALHFGQRQVGNDTLPVGALLHDHLVGLAEDLLHGFEEDALARHVLGLLVLLVDGEEACRLAFGIRDDVAAL